MLRAMFACHDLGKLDVQWQKWAHEWQKRAVKLQFYEKEAILLPDYMAAHTDYDPNDKAQWKAQTGVRPKRPNHAGESTIAGAKAIQFVSRENKALLKAALTAIARHHTSTVKGYQKYYCHDASKKAFEQALAEVILASDLSTHIIWESDGSAPLSRVLVNFNESVSEEFLLYFLLVRILRLADQRSQSK